MLHTQKKFEVNRRRCQVATWKENRFFYEKNSKSFILQHIFLRLALPTKENEKKFEIFKKFYFHVFNASKVLGERKGVLGVLRSRFLAKSTRQIIPGRPESCVKTDNTVEDIF